MEIELPKKPSTAAAAGSLWRKWPETQKALLDTYYRTAFSPADQAYALAGLQRVGEMWEDLHGQKNVPHQFLDAACAHEVWYHHYRAREFRRPCAALSACWSAIISERPERVFDRWTRAQLKADRKTRHRGALIV